MRFLEALILASLMISLAGCQPPRDRRHAPARAAPAQSDCELEHDDDDGWEYECEDGTEIPLTASRHKTPKVVKAAPIRKIATNPTYRPARKSFFRSRRR